jgi:hypothetical protein
MARPESNRDTTGPGNRGWTYTKVNCPVWSEGRAASA